MSTSPDALRVETAFGLPSFSVGKVGSAFAQPSGSVRFRMPLVQREPVRVARRPGVDTLLPLGVRLAAAVDDLPGVREHVVGDGEVHVRVEAEDLLGLADLVLAERGAVRLAGVLLGRRRPADDRAHRDERRLVGDRAAPSSIACSSATTSSPESTRWMCQP